MPLRESNGHMPDGRTIDAFTLSSPQGLRARVMTYGAIVLSLDAPDLEGRAADVVLGYEDLAGYLDDRNFVGGVIGRYANRIGDARFTLDGDTCELDANDGPNLLHGGFQGLHRRLWDAEPFDSTAGEGVRLRCVSEDGDAGFPGRLQVAVEYVVTPRNELVVDYAATTDRPTHVNLTQHSYFNLAGAGDVLDHRLTIDAARYTPTDPLLIPTGEREPVEGTPFDFREPTAIGARIAEAHEQRRRAGGYDHNFVLRDGDAFAGAARVVDPASGRTLEVWTTEPGLHFYSGNFLGGGPRGKPGRAYRPREGFCLETQHFPDSPNRPEFPSTALRPGQELRSRTVFAFGPAPPGLLVRGRGRR